MATSRESRPSSRLGRLERSAAAPTANVQHRTNPKRNAPMMARMAIVSILGPRGDVPGFPCDLDVEAVTAVPADGDRSRGSIVFLRCRSGGASLPSRIASQGRQREPGRSGAQDLERSNVVAMASQERRTAVNLRSPNAKRMVGRPAWPGPGGL